MDNFLDNVARKYGIYHLGGDPRDVLDNLFDSYEEAEAFMYGLGADVEAVIVGVIVDEEEV